MVGGHFPIVISSCVPVTLCTGCREEQVLSSVKIVTIHRGFACSQDYANALPSVVIPVIKMRAGLHSSKRLINMPAVHLF